MSKRGKKKGRKLLNPLEGLRPTQRRTCGHCGRVRQVENLTVVYSIADGSPLVCCWEHYPWDFIR